MNTREDRPAGHSRTRASSIGRFVDAFTGGNERRFLVWSLVLGLLVHGAFTYLALQQRWTLLRIDEVNVARRLVGGMGYCFNYYRLFGEDHVEGAFFPPAYVYNVFFLFKTFGVRWTLPIQNLILTLATSFCLYALGKRVVGERAARIALIASLVYPPFFTRIGHGSPVYFKMLFMVLMVMALQRVWERCRETGSRGFMPEVVAGVLGGFLALSMPDALAYLLLFAAALVIAHRFRPASWRASLIVLACAGLTIAPWTARNWIQLERFCLVSSNGGFNFYMGNCPGSQGEVDYTLVTDLDERLDGELARTDEFGRDKILYREAFAHIASNKLDAVGSFAQRAALHWFFRPENLRALAALGDEDSEFDRSFQTYIWTYAITYVPLAILALLGFLSLRERWFQLAPLWLTFVYSTAIASMFVVQTKMRLIKVEPFLILFAAYYVASRFPSSSDAPEPESAHP